MNLLDKEDLIEMVNKNDYRKLRLHWEGDYNEASEETAHSVLATIEEMVEEGQDEKDLWDWAYICTEEDYIKEQKEEDEDE